MRRSCGLVCVLAVITFIIWSLAGRKADNTPAAPASSKPVSLPTSTETASPITPSPHAAPAPPPNVVYCDWYLLARAFVFNEFTLRPDSGKYFRAVAVDISNSGHSVITVNELDFSPIVDSVAYHPDFSAEMALRTGSPRLQPVSMGPGGRCWGAIAFQLPAVDHPWVVAFLWDPVVSYGTPIKIETTYKGRWQFP